MPDPKLVIFDCDGVLVDSEVISAEVLIAELARVGVVMDVEYVYRTFVGKSFPTVVEIIRQSFDTSLSEDFLDRYRLALMDAFGERLCLTDGIADVLSHLDRPYCLATSSSPPRLKRTLDLSGLGAWFGKRAFTASQVANGKPAPDLFLFAASQMGVEPENCLAIEDSEPGLLAALAAGMQVWRYTGGSHFRGAPPPLTGALRHVPSFDNWAQFYQMAPQLRRQGR